MAWEIRYRSKIKNQRMEEEESSIWFKDPVEGNYGLSELEKAKKQAQKQIRESMIDPLLVWEEKLT